MMNYRKFAMSRTLGQLGLFYGLVSRTARIVKRAENERGQDSFAWILATEAPTRVWDWDQWDLVDEILIADGLKVPENGQVPLLDNHLRRSTEDQLGHVTGFGLALASGYPAVSGIVSFAADEKSQTVRQKVADNHITDGSVGYLRLKSLWIPENQQVAIDGRVFSGPGRVTYEWSLLEFSMTPIGADAFAKKM